MFRVCLMEDDTFYCDTSNKGITKPFYYTYVSHYCKVICNGIPLRLRWRIFSKETSSSTQRLYRYFCYLFLFLHLPSLVEGFCPPKCFCDDDSLRVECANASLDLIPFLLNPQVKVLKFPCNNIKTVGQSLTFYPDLESLDLSHNHIESLDVEDFQAQSNIKIVKLNQNKLKSIKNKIFNWMVELKELYLNYNDISLIESNSFENSNQLRILDLSHNKLKSFNEETFSKTNKLEILKLNYNHFYEVPTNAINKIKSLTELELIGNQLSQVPDRAFKSLEHLASITIDKNNISAIFPLSFEGLNHLVSLSIKDNRLATVPGASFEYLTNLEELDLSGNLFQVLDKNAFKHPSALVHLRLTRCPRLSRIDSETFKNLENLKTLHLSHNARLIHLGASTFSSLSQLTDLDLTACGLVYIDPEQMPRSRTTKLHLAGNPLHCNCSLLWLASLPLNNSYSMDAPTCATPPNLYGVPVSQVDLRAAGCDYRLGLTAIATCVGVVLLGILIIAIFLAWRWRKRNLSTSKALPVTTERVLREPWPGPAVGPVPLPYQRTPIFVPKYCLPSQVSFPTNGHNQCHTVCSVGGNQQPYSLHPVTRPLLTPPSPSPNNHSQVPVEWLYPSPYDEDTHWYTTIGRDGREYLTGDIKREHPPPPVPPPPDSPPPLHPPILNTPSSTTSVRLKRNNSSVRSHHHTPILPNRPPFYVPGDGSADGQQVPVTYI